MSFSASLINWNPLRVKKKSYTTSVLVEFTKLVSLTSVLRTLHVEFSNLDAHAPARMKLWLFIVGGGVSSKAYAAEGVIGE